MFRRGKIGIQIKRLSFPRKIVEFKMRYWEIIADNLSKAGWSWGCVSAIDSNDLDC